MKCKILAVSAICVLTICAPLSTGAPAQPPTPNTNRTQSQGLLRAYGKMPLSFEVNDGQTNPQVKFLSRGAGYELFLTSTEAVLAMGKTGGQSHDAQGQSKSPQASGFSVLRLKLLGSNVQAKVSGTDELPGKTNYFIGSDPNHWRTDIRQYGKVRYHDVYPGIDLVYYGNQGQLEHDFVVAPGADVKRIHLSMSGAERVSVDPHDDLVLGMSNGEVKLKKPIAYQEIAGVRHEISSRYELDGGQVGFEVGSYDRSRALVIDPIVSYLSYLGGSNDDAQVSTSIAVDSTGNAYIATGTLSIDFPVTAGALQTTYGGAPLVCSQNQTTVCGDATITKVSPDGSTLIYATYLGGSSGDYPFGLAVDVHGAVYVAGYTESTDFPVTAGAYQTAFAGRSLTCPPPYFACGDGFVTKINPAGTKLVYSTYIGGTGDDYIENLAIDPSGNAYVTGSTDSADYPTTAAAFQTTLPCTIAACANGFVSKLNASGTALVYSTFLSGTAGSSGFGIAVNSFSEAVLAGSTTSTDFPVTASAFQPQLAPGLCGTPPSIQCPDTFVTKLNAAGNGLLYSTYLGGAGWDTPYGLTLDFQGRAYIAGFTASSDFPTTPGAYHRKFGGGTCNAYYGVACSDAILVKIDTTKSGAASLVYSTFFGGDLEDQATSVAVNAAGDAFLTGWTFSSPHGIAGDAFLAEFDPTGAKLVFFQLVGGSGYDTSDSVAVDHAGYAYIAGRTQSTDLPTTKGVFQPKFGGGPGDCFVAKFKGF
jgi:hypothetical protein